MQKARLTNYGAAKNNSLPTAYSASSSGRGAALSRP
ncbi:unnamed protein product [Porites evermanni]|uniref:Uncharacterized protein n=1 Tax=Porites evermanni TaxID=104178 RepID=A0ABN8S0X8_9CNID|nr:unnamed protein product [Porites evermanni]